MDNRFEDDGRGVLTVRDVRRDDAGTFTCTGSNFYSLDTDKATIYVGGKNYTTGGVLSLVCYYDSYVINHSSLRPCIGFLWNLLFPNL